MSQKNRADGGAVFIGLKGCPIVLFGFHAGLFHGFQLAQVDAAHRLLQRIDAVGVAVGLDREALADDHAVFAGFGLAVPFLMHQVAAGAVGLLVAVVGLLLLFRRHRGSHRDEALGAAGIGDFQGDPLVVGAGVFGAGLRHLHAHGAIAFGRDAGAL